ncbi:MAG: hypothetical protein A2991_01365 [Candidatus Terrybacteria bacterium RIFCSPLOWO2_01_FULL_58_14]|uniref:SUF system FeS cluster assembly SufBD core domain-containing protein n=1 Tax=Candidatus Terrybacteria bacterium RIFCSPLOWO2_01_FULL_58_14 TaxID=1802369 RepID=A0A1G2PYS5_9BACT|nr:MAG: hypothetical protein A2991_01365 [Candidatus Terrybacteria bacterium RIFCSPLOWO2_01_FULL_58_14]
MQEITVIEREVRKLDYLWDSGNSAPRAILVRLVAAGAEVALRGFFFTRAREELAVRIEVRHEAPQTKSRVVLRGIAKDASSARIHEVAILQKGAKGAEAHVEAKAILTSDQARAELEPYLEIDEDEVRATHSAWVGPLEEDERFYLMSRGFSPAKADALLLAAFLAPVADFIPTRHATQRFSHFHTTSRR